MTVCRCGHSIDDHPARFLCQRCRCPGWIPQTAAGRRPDSEPHQLVLDAG